MPGSIKLFGALDFLGSEDQMWGWGALGLWRSWLPHFPVFQHSSRWHGDAENFIEKDGRFFPVNCLQGRGGGELSKSKIGLSKLQAII